MAPKYDDFVQRLISDWKKDVQASEQKRKESERLQEEAIKHTGDARALLTTIHRYAPDFDPDKFLKAQQEASTKKVPQPPTHGANGSQAAMDEPKGYAALAKTVLVRTGGGTLDDFRKFMREKGWAKNWTAKENTRFVVTIHGLADDKRTKNKVTKTKTADGKTHFVPTPELIKEIQDGEK